MAVQSEIKTLMDSLNEPRILIREDFSVAYVNRAFVYRYGQRDYEGLAMKSFSIKESAVPLVAMFAL